VLGADPVPRETREEPGQLLENARASIQPVPGTLVVRGGQPIRFHAIVHDLEEEPSWREEWVVSALREVLQEVGARGLRSLSALAETGVEHLDEVWLTVPPDIAVEIANRLRAIGIEVRERARE
jgi:hypothetical protein